VEGASHREPFPGVATPNLDALRREGVTFMRAFGDGQPTIPMRRSFYTGVRSYPWRFAFDRKGLWPNGAGWHKIPPEQTALAEQLLHHGYRTALISDLYHEFKPTLNFTRGFLNWEFIRGQESDNWKGGHVEREELAHYTLHPDDRAQAAVLIQYLLNKRHFAPGELSGGMTFACAIDWLVENHDLQPFMLWVECFDPHEPWDPPRAYADRYMPGYMGRDLIFPRAEGATEAERERIKALYFGEVTYIDAWVGRLMNRLSDLHLLDSTVVMFLSDHGTELLDHGRFGKSASHLFAHNTQLNWVIRHPDGPRGVEVEALVQAQDVVPTALDLLGLPPLAVDGHSAWPLVSDPNTGPQQIVIGWGDYASVRSAGWNYVVNTVQPEGSERLYDLRADPLEEHDVAPRYPAELAAARQVLADFLGASLPARFPDVSEGTTAPARVYYKAETPSRAHQQAGFV
ncbi:MAG: sulfatase, partial [Chloroflexi bacterium]|nr:sulfatase [Chloroflexota bacterium]